MKVKKKNNFYFTNTENSSYVESLYSFVGCFFFSLINRRHLYSFLTELFELGTWPMRFFCPAFTEVHQWLTLLHIHQAASHGFRRYTLLRLLKYSPASKTVIRITHDPCYACRFLIIWVFLHKKNVLYVHFEYLKVWFKRR